MMAKGDVFLTRERKKAALKNAETSGTVADSMAVRIALIERMNKGELTLEEVQAELARIKRGAKAAGMTTRARAFREG